MFKTLDHEFWILKPENCPGIFTGENLKQLRYCSLNSALSLAVESFKKLVRMTNGSFIGREGKGLQFLVKDQSKPKHCVLLASVSQLLVQKK